MLKPKINIFVENQVDVDFIQNLHKLYKNLPTQNIGDKPNKRT